MSSFSTQNFFELARNPQQIREVHLASLEEIVKEYPAFTGARMLLLGGLKNSGSYKFNGQLRITAAHVQQRTALFRFIVETLEEIGEKSSLPDNKADIDTKKAAKTEEGEIAGDVHINPKPAPIDVPKETSRTDEWSSEIPKDADGGNEEEVEQNTISEEDGAEQIEKSREIPPIGSPLSFSPREMHSFSEWLSLLEMSPVTRKEGESDTPAIAPLNEERSEDSIIARFLAAQPKIKAPEKVPRHTESSTPPVSQPTNQLMTETLARVYEEQGLYERAITAYEILILKYPEKSSFFADRIRELKLLTSNRE